MNRVDRHSSQGFTIIELLVAMAFVSVLMLTIAATVIQISNIYNKGLTMRAVDQSGRAISFDVRQTLGQAQPFNPETALCLQRLSVQHCDNSLEDAEAGRLCTGVYSYVWNLGKALSSPVNKYSSGDDEIRFARVRDNGAQYCAEPNKAIQQEDATELLSAGDRNLAVHSFNITQLVEDAAVGQALYKIVMEIGTNDREALSSAATLQTMDTSCRPPSEGGSMQNFCAVNKFEFTVQAGNKGGI